MCPRDAALPSSFSGYFTAGDATIQLDGSAVYVARTGDLVSSMFLQVDLPHLQNWRDQLSMPVETHGHISSVAWVNSIGHALIGAVSVEIGGQKIDEHYGTWLEIWDELTTKSEKRAGYNQMIGK